MDAGTNELADYIIAERDRLALLGTPLGSTDKDALSPYFEPSLLNSVRVVIGESIREPGFAARFRAAGLSVPEFSLADAVTLDRVIVAKQPLSRFTLFHELVHVVQWRILGIDSFAQRYLLEYRNHGYDSMPLERMAVKLARRYEAGELFSVEEAINDAV
jgi:hypothetical protein